MCFVQTAYKGENAMVDMEKGKVKNEKLWTVLGILFLMIGCLCNLEEKPQVEQPENPPVEEQIAEEQPLLKYEVVKIEELSKNRLNIRVLVKEKPTVERLVKLSNHLVGIYTKKSGVHGIYLNFTRNVDSVYTYGQAEYGPNGSAAYNVDNLGKEKRLDTSGIKLMSDEMIKDLDESEAKAKRNKPIKEKLKKHVLGLLSDYKIDELSFDIVTFEEGFTVSFTVLTDELNPEKIGVEIINKIRNSNPPSTIAEIDVIVMNKYQALPVRFNGEKYYKFENGETIDIEI